ncbi:MAG: hypothetical protein A2660_00475 [Candidatus Doudnabacteria bacterium RIFCSPHIGHO2_01_FULL_45_18]|uniref:Penicillin-binding protein transpeptidase domain-containing protein n=1 Tax=Candidatus Doudnabacteria bacterium RIFCSPHIGHO2_01_FULL_45_18 TaxID=1817823 RepID=A0A1F5NQF5_9BACT|nr:MAG: hypothetical protein A2660_00475 [Candidatus Doudnabacteria bacterium RIFCSPHIGHO2_01_FULL_45_18]
MIRVPSELSETKLNSYNLRIFLLMLIFAIAMGLIAIRLFNLQILNHSYYASLAASQHNTEATISSKRGEIYFSSLGSGSPILVATNVSKNMVFAVPKEITDKSQTATKLASLLDMSQADVLAKIEGNGSFVVLKKQVEDDVSSKLAALKLKGIHLEAQDIRFYPEKDLASQVIGFLGFQGDNRVGQYGVEGRYEENLSGRQGIFNADTDPLGRWIPTATRNFLPAQDGDDLYLTIDSVIQFKVQDVLKNSVAKHGADSGSVVVINPKTGAVLAMASEPSFDLNNYGKVEDQSVYTNKVLAADYEPGSVFKAFTMAAALNEGKVTPQTTYMDEGLVQVDDKQIKNSDPKPLGEQTMIQVLNASLNTGAVFAQQQIGNDKFREYVERFGFGRPVEFDLAGQTAGDIDNLDRKGSVFFATAAFGQGITISPLQLAQGYSALANSGKMVTPYIVSQIVHPDGSVTKTDQRDPRQVIDSKTAVEISAMLVDVVENGHGKNAAVKGYYIAGKTGTAQVAAKFKSGYDPDTNIGTFVGYGPVDDPQFLMVVRIDNPKDVKFAESTAAPTFGEIASFILNYLQIPPSRQ